MGHAGSYSTSLGSTGEQFRRRVSQTRPIGGCEFQNRQLITSDRRLLPLKHSRDMKPLAFQRGPLPDWLISSYLLKGIQPLNQARTKPEVRFARALALTIPPNQSNGLILIDNVQPTWLAPTSVLPLCPQQWASATGSRRTKPNMALIRPGHALQNLESLEQSEHLAANPTDESSTPKTNNSGRHQDGGCPSTGEHKPVKRQDPTNHKLPVAKQSQVAAESFAHSRKRTKSAHTGCTNVEPWRTYSVPKDPHSLFVLRNT
jgi:hypothetical protein